MEQLVCTAMNVDSRIDDFILELNLHLEDQNSIYRLHLNSDNSVDIILEDDEADVTVSSLVLIPVKEAELVTLDDSGECLITLIAYSNKVFLRPWTVSPKVILDKNAILCHWGIKALDYLTAKQFGVSLKVFFELAKSIPKAKIYWYDGWDKLGQEFILGNLKISQNNVEKVEIEQNKKAIPFDETLSSGEICQFINEIYFNVTRDRVYAEIIFTYYFLGLSMKKFLEQGMVTSFLLGIIGPSGSFKTSSMIPMLNPTDLASSSFDDTPATIIDVIKKNLYGCTLIDDMNNKCSEKVAKLEKIIRMGGDRTTSSKKDGCRKS